MRKERYNSGQMTVNYKNVNCIETVKTDDGFELFYLYKSKIKTEKLKLPKIFKDVLSLRSYFDGLGFYSIGNYFINSSNFDVIEEVEFNEDLNTQSVRIYMHNTQPIDITMDRKSWLMFKNAKLVL